MSILATRRGRNLLLPALLASALCLCPRAGAEISDSDRALAEKVFAQLLTVTHAPGGMPWPPKLELIDKDEINAYAAMQKDDNGKERPVVFCYAGLIHKAVEGNSDRLAFILGHEMAHHLLGHTRKPDGDTEFLRATFSREQELAADREGMMLALRASFSYREGLTVFHRVLDLGVNYSSFEGLGYDHPSWLDRVALLDKDQAALWRSMSSFNNGVYFLLVQNYPLAERAFRQVTKDFPGSDEAWSNLGYALLMQYADSLDAEDLRHFDVGQIVAGGFYRRPKSLESQVRGINEEIWWDAVGALREAIRLKPDLALPKANLGIAYLLRPAGKDVGKATQLLEEAADLASKDQSLDAVSRLADQINLAVAYESEGSSDKALAVLGHVETSLKQADHAPLQGAASLSNALAYNRALLLSRSPDSQQQRLAIAQFESYLRQTGPSLAWWPLAYQRYSELCKQSGITARSKDALLADTTPRFRPVAALDLGKTEVALGDPLAQAKEKLGTPASSAPVVRGTNLALLDYPDRGVKLLATDEVLAIFLSGGSAPSLPIKEMGLGAKSMELKIGMTNTDLDRLMGDADYDFRQLVDPNLNYRFYSDIGIAVLSESGKITQLVIGQVPKQQVRL